MAGEIQAGEVDRHTLQTSDGVTLSALEAGKEHAAGKNLKIVFVPGWSMPATIWQNQLEQFGRRYHTLALDPRGQGDTVLDVPAGPARLELTADGYSNDARWTILHELEIRPDEELVVEYP